MVLCCQEISDDESDEFESCPCHSGSCQVVLTEKQQTQLGETFLALLAMAPERRTEVAKTEADCHFQAMGMQPHRIAMFCDEAGLDREHVDLAEWLRFHECIAASEGGDFLIDILIGQGAAIMAARPGNLGKGTDFNNRLRELYETLVKECTVDGQFLEARFVPAGAAASYFRKLHAPTEFVAKYEVMEELILMDECLDDLTEEVWLEIFESLFSRESRACDWLVEKLNSKHDAN